MDFFNDSFRTSVGSSLEDLSVVEFNGALTLSYEELTNVNTDYARFLGPRTHALDLTGNDLTDLSFLGYFTKLHTLVLDGNTHMFIRTLPHINGLSTFWANNCNIQNYPEFIAVLADRFPNLKFLCILNNPGVPSYISRSRFYSIILYRNFVINRFALIQHLDDCRVMEKKSFFHMALCYLYRRSRANKYHDKSIKFLFSNKTFPRKKCTVRITVPRLI
ncbi:uncharacterized protein LOC132264828 [Phlebotomus argentipes]|uniref:uncharacterized protein LOC132264828 n=1 Tax=Phlebotomus argentipes TaxID=94469 RepID=UPI002893062E|nr:uncharacterized protein LOC132264828 [Phlebotomus argentipes]